MGQRNELLAQKRCALQQFRPIKREYVDDYRHTCIELTNHNSKLSQVIDFVTKLIWEIELKNSNKPSAKSELSQIEEEQEREFRRTHKRSQSMDVDQVAHASLFHPELNEPGQHALHSSGSMERRDTSPILKANRQEQAPQEPKQKLRKWSFKCPSQTHEAKLTIAQVDIDADR